jgi:hypothetical protein
VVLWQAKAFNKFDPDGIVEHLPYHFFVDGCNLPLPQQRAPEFWLKTRQTDAPCRLVMDVHSNERFTNMASVALEATVAKSEVIFRPNRATVVEKLTQVMLRAHFLPPNLFAKLSIPRYLA